MKIRNVILAAFASTLLFAASAHAQNIGGVPISGTPVPLEGEEGGLKTRPGAKATKKQAAPVNPSGAGPKRQQLNKQGRTGSGGNGWSEDREMIRR